MFVLVAALFIVVDANLAEGDKMGEAVIPVGTVLVERLCPSFGKMTEPGGMARESVEDMSHSREMAAVGSRHLLVPHPQSPTECSIEHLSALSE